MAVYHETENTEIVKDKDGNVLSVTTEKNTSKIGKSTEPDYIKIYTNMWCEFNQIPERWRELFLQLAMRMSYADAGELYGGQCVNTTGPNKDSILLALNCKENNFRKGLQALVKAKAIRKIARGWYQINPTYAGKGEWKYDAKKKQGGIENIITSFDFKGNVVQTEIIYEECSSIGIDGRSKEQSVITQALAPEEDEMFEHSALSGGNNQDTKKGA